MRAFLSWSILAVATPALAQTTVPPPALGQPTAAAATPNPLDKVICRTEETIGSRLKKHKVCATLREWQEQEAENRVAAQGMQGVGTGCPEGGSGPGC